MQDGESVLLRNKLQKSTICKFVSCSQARNQGEYCEFHFKLCSEYESAAMTQEEDRFSCKTLLCSFQREHGSEYCVYHSLGLKDTVQTKREALWPKCDMQNCENKSAVGITWCVEHQLQDNAERYVPAYPTLPHQQPLAKVINFDEDHDLQVALHMSMTSSPQTFGSGKSQEATTSCSSSSSSSSSSSLFSSSSMPSRLTEEKHVISLPLLFHLFEDDDTPIRRCFKRMLVPLNEHDCLRSKRLASIYLKSLDTYDQELYIGVHHLYWSKDQCCPMFTLAYSNMSSINDPTNFFAMPSSKTPILAGLMRWDFKSSTYGLEGDPRRRWFVLQPM
jgi:hypothetical protein